jgi:hypothetical protein
MILYHALLLVALTAQTERSVCRTDRQHSGVVAYAETAVRAGFPPYVFCVFGSLDGPSVWLHSIEVYEKESGERLGELVGIVNWRR